MIYLIFAATLLAIAIASITDLKKREVPDLVSFMLIGFCLGIRGIYSILLSNPGPFIEGLVGFVICLLVSLAMYYGGQWGGGDAKMLMGIGASLGIPLSLASFPLILVFFIHLLLAGAVFGLLFSAIIAARNWKKFKAEFFRHLRRKEIVYMQLSAGMIAVIAIVSVLLITDFLVKMAALITAGAFLIFVYLFAFVRSVERSCMHRKALPKELTEGDWLAKPVIVDKEIVISQKNIGLTKSQLRQLAELYRRKKIKHVVLKEGIPFLPSFLAAYLLTFFLGAWFLLL